MVLRRLLEPSKVRPTGVHFAHDSPEAMAKSRDGHLELLLQRIVSSYVAVCHAQTRLFLVDRIPCGEQKVGWRYARYAQSAAADMGWQALTIGVGIYEHSECAHLIGQWSATTSVVTANLCNLCCTAHLPSP